jgi:putative endonuclease
MTEQNLTGKKGEEEACNLLIKQGYEIYHTNWRWNHYEIDVIAAHAGELVIVEVKTRSGDCLLSPEESVNHGKIKRLVAAADVYVRRFGLDMPVRFDVVTVTQSGSGYTTEHIEDAFYAPVQRQW